MTEPVADWMKEKAADQAGALAQASLKEGVTEPGEICAFYRTAYTAILATISGAPDPSAATVDKVEPLSASDIRKSIKPGGIVSFIDGKSYKTLKRHLTGAGLTPETYRAKFGLPADYPMVCSEYSQARSTLAKQTGLGQRPAATA